MAPCAVAIVANLYPASGCSNGDKGHKTVAMSAAFSGMYLGGGLAVSSILFSKMIGWRWVTTIFGSIGLGVLFCIVTFIPSGLVSHAQKKNRAPFWSSLKTLLTNFRFVCLVISAWMMYALGSQFMVRSPQRVRNDMSENIDTFAIVQTTFELTVGLGSQSTLR